MIRIIDIPIYRCSVVFLIETTRAEWDSFFKEQNEKATLTERDNLVVVEEYDAETPGFVVGTNGNDYVVRIGDKNNPGLVAHEIYHVANLILTERGVVLEKIGEPWAYLIEYITNEFYSIIEGA